MAEVYENAIEAKEMENLLKDYEISVLQAQINPHFLYNTLASIQALILTHDERAIDMIQMLGDMFRTGLGNRNRFITVQKELEYVQLYLGIQSIRYGNQFEVKYEIDPYVNNLYTIKFIIQPFVENCIIHGFDEIEKGGRIYIKSYVRNDFLIFTIEDNGIGISMDSINADDKNNKESKLGIRNIYERIRLYFGSPYGITIRPQVQGGTKVFVRVPVLKTSPV